MTPPPGLWFQRAKAERKKIAVVPKSTPDLGVNCNFPLPQLQLTQQTTAIEPQL
jgi:hypothetical protein